MIFVLLIYNFLMIAVRSLNKFSTQENYEDVPINGFGYAMLRGMGWKDENKSAEVHVPEIRPMNLGLGADKLIIQKQIKEPEEPGLKLQKGSYVKILIGKESGNYGQVEGFDENAERLIVKMTLSGQTISLYESMIQLVTKNEYAANAKVLNSKKYEEYKNKENTKKRSDSDEGDKKTRARDRSQKSNDRHTKLKKSRHKSESDDDDSDRDRSVKSNVKSRSKNSRRKSETESSDDSDTERKRRRKRSSSSSSNDRSRKHKKSKKHKNRGSSSERLSKKNRKKDKERERNRNKRSNDYYKSADKKHYKKHRRSRSKS